MSNKNNQTDLTLLVRNYLSDSHLDYLQTSSLKATTSLISRGQYCPLQDHSFEFTLLQTLGIDTDTQSDLPIAALTLAADKGSKQDGWWCRADPVHLSAGRDSLVLSAHEELYLTLDQANKLIAELLQTYQEDNWQLMATDPHRWYLKLKEPPKILTSPLSQVYGKNIFPFMPTGEDSQQWRTILNEVQLLLHATKFNQQRESEGLLPVNSLWFWGGGEAPQCKTNDISEVYADDLISKGFAQLAGVTIKNNTDDANSWLQQAGQTGYTLQVLDARPRMEQDDWQYLEHHWMQPLLDALKKNKIDRLTLIGEMGRRFVITAKQARQIHWLGRKPILDYFRVEQREQ